MLFNFVFCFAFFHFLDLSITDESFVEESRVWRKYKNLILISMMSLFTATGSMPLLVEFYFPEGITSPEVITSVVTCIIIDMVIIINQHFF